jgi:hypothetical protein
MGLIALVLLQDSADGEGIVNLFGGLNCRAAGRRGWVSRPISGAVGQAAVVVPVTSFHAVNRTAISRRYCSAASR